MQEFPKFDKLFLIESFYRLHAVNKLLYRSAYHVTSNHIRSVTIVIDLRKSVPGYGIRVKKILSRLCRTRWLEEYPLRRMAAGEKVRGLFFEFRDIPEEIQGFGVFQGVLVFHLFAFDHFFHGQFHLFHVQGIGNIRAFNDLGRHMAG